MGTCFEMSEHKKTNKHKMAPYNLSSVIQESVSSEIRSENTLFFNPCKVKSSL